MEDYEKKAEKIIITAYKKGGSISYDDALGAINANNVSEEIKNILSIFGEIYANTFGVSEIWDTYRLNEKGMKFARSGCFTGEKKRLILYKTGAIAAIITAIATLLGFFFPRCS